MKTAILKQQSADSLLHPVPENGPALTKESLTPQVVVRIAQAIPRVSTKVAPYLTKASIALTHSELRDGPDIETRRVKRAEFTSALVGDAVDADLKGEILEGVSQLFRAHDTAIQHLQNTAFRGDRKGLEAHLTEISPLIQQGHHHFVSVIASAFREPTIQADLVGYITTFRPKDLGPQPNVIRERLPLYRAATNLLDPANPESFVEIARTLSDNNLFSVTAQSLIRQLGYEGIRLLYQDADSFQKVFAKINDFFTRHRGKEGIAPQVAVARECLELLRNAEYACTGKEVA